MPHEAQWLAGKKVIHMKYTGIVEREELSELNNILSTYIEDGEEPIHIITDLTDMDKLNVDMKSLRTTFTIMWDTRWGWIMIVGADPITKFFGQLVSHAFGKKMRIVKTLDDAKYALGIEDSRLTDAFHSQSGTE